jgi:hypothetical protein
VFLVSTFYLFIFEGMATVGLVRISSRKELMTPHEIMLA